MTEDRPSILIVDSNKGFARMLKESLEQDGDYEAMVAQDGAEALEIASGKRFDLAIVDLGINAVDGLYGETVARQLREGQKDLRLMLIPLEGDALPSELADLDVQGTLPKPFFLPDLPDLLTGALTKPIEVREEPAEAKEPRPETERLVEEVPAPEIREEWPLEAVRELENLAQELNADAVLVSQRRRVLASAGRLEDEALRTLAHIVFRSCQLSSQAAQVVGREQSRVEQSVEGNEHMLYFLTITEDILLSAMLRPDVTLGFLRHEVKRTVRQLQDLIAAP